MKNLSHRLLLSIALLCCFAISVPAIAGVPLTLNNQGRLTDNSPQQLPIEGPTAMEFRLYGSATGSDLLWSESWPNVQVTGGIYNVLLGSNGSPIPKTVFSESVRFLEVVVNGETLSPRQQLGSVAFAFEAERLAQVCAQGQMLQRIGGEWVCADVSVCPQGGSVSCYTGPAGTVDVGTCRPGTAVCNADGSDYDACTGSVVPTTEVCFNGLDDDCNGTVDDSCSCPPNQTNCSGVCVDTNSDSDNCMACGNACGIGQSCQNGACTVGAIYAGMITNPADPTTSGPGVPSVFEYAGEIGISAGDAMCQAINADHICRYEELNVAESVGELGQLLQMPGQTFWLHRTQATVQVQGISSAPGAGGRCNDWTYPTGHIADGEFGSVSTDGRIDYFFDRDTTFSGNTADGHAGSGPLDGGECGGAFRAILCCN